MIKIIVSLIVVFTSLNSFAQNQVLNGETNPNDKAQNCNEVAAYKLFPTQNMWTFIKLNTRNGRMWQVQFDIEGDNRLKPFCS